MPERVARLRIRRVAKQDPDEALVLLSEFESPLRHVVSAEIAVLLAHLTSIVPDSTQPGTSIGITITGSNFVSGASVVFENGNGPTPTVSNVVWSNATTITATVTVKNGGPRRDRVWSVRVTNPDGSTDVLVGGFTVKP